jgi:hypothetical protein
MFPLVAFPAVVEHYAPHFAAVFSPEAFIQFKRYISGLLVSENKTVDGINRLFVVESRHQSSLNRLLTASPFTLTDLNHARLAVLQAVPGTQFKATGVLSFDDTLLTHVGQHFEQIAYLYDHSQQRYTWAHNLVTLHYSDDLTDYPVAFELWQPADLTTIEQGLRAADIPLKASKTALKDTDPAKWRQYLLGVWRRHQHQDEVATLYDSKLRIAERLIQQWVDAHPTLRLPVTFDSWYTQPAFCHYLDHLAVPYVGTLAEDQLVVLKSGTVTVADFAARLQAEQAAHPAGTPPLFRPITIPFKAQREAYYSYCATHQLKNFGKVRLVINHRQADLADKPVYYISNHLPWQAAGLTRIRRHRWPVEGYHEEGKAEGLDQYQLRDFEAISRHVALVAVVYSLLRAAQQDPVLQQALQRELQFELEGSVPYWRRVTQAQSLWSLALFISAGLTQGQSLGDVMAPLLRAIGSR